MTDTNLFASAIHCILVTTDQWDSVNLFSYFLISKVIIVLMGRLFEK